MQGQDDPRAVVDDARSDFPDQTSSAVMPCHPSPLGRSDGSCSLDQIKKNLSACDGGSDAWNWAKRGTGQDPVITVGATQSGFDAESHVDGTITIKPTNCCSMTYSLVMELNNVAQAKSFKEIDEDAADGNLPRWAYIYANERREYDSVMATLKAYDSCKEKWGCGDAAKATFDQIRKTTDFQDFFDHYLADAHKENYGKYWDKKFKDAYDWRQTQPKH